MWVQRDVAVDAELGDRDTQPVGRSNLHDRVGGQSEQFATTDAGAGQQFDDQPDNGCESARAARRSLVAAASSRNRGSGLSMTGKVAGNSSGWDGAFS